MTRPIKFLLLFLALLLPGLIYVFLKSFGKNEFQVPALFQDEVPVVAGCESYPRVAPYHVPASTVARLGLRSNSLSLVAFEPNNALPALSRVKNEFGDEGFAYVEPADSLRLSAACELILQPPANVVLVDGTGLIRGQYDVSDRDEVDRLILEMKILLKKY
jgi:hypothetical protein